MFRKPRRTTATIAALVAPLLTLSACSTGSGDGDDGTLEVLTSFYPLQMVAEEVGGDRVEVSSLTPPGAEPHDVELSPAQVASLDAADLVVVQSGFQAAVDDALAQTAPAHVVDATDVVALATPTADEAHEEDHPDDDGHDHEHDHDGLDPHFWLDPTLMPAVADAVADALAEIDPEGADTYRALSASALAR